MFSVSDVATTDPYGNVNPSKRKPTERNADNEIRSDQMMVSAPYSQGPL